MRLVATTLTLLLLHIGAACCASSTLDRVREQGVLRCGSAIRPGLAFPDEDHVPHGLHVEMCRAIAAAVLGDPGKIEFHFYAVRPDFERSRGADDVAFLTATEMFGNALIDAVLPGPTVFRLSTTIMVWDTSPIHHVAELARTMVCDEPGTSTERSLVAYAAAHRWDANLSGWMELEEMMDAFNVGRCPAVVGEATALSALRIGSAQQGHPARLLPEAIAITPIMAASPIDDPHWAALVGWTIGTVMANQGGDDRLRIPGPWLGLDAAWQARVRSLGGYDEMYRRTLGNESMLDLAPGGNRSWRDGGLVVAPTID